MTEQPTEAAQADVEVKGGANAVTGDAEAEAATGDVEAAQAEECESKPDYIVAPTHEGRLPASVREKVKRRMTQCDEHPQEEDGEGMMPTMGSMGMAQVEGPPIDENGNIMLDRLIDEDGNPVKQYPLPSDPRDRRADFENALMRGYLEKMARENGTEPPPRVYQSEFDRKWHEWCDRNWDRYERTRGWAEVNAPRSLWFADKVHDVMYWIGEKSANALGITTSRYQWVIDAAEWHAYMEEKERQEEAEALAEEEEEQNRIAAEREAALEGGGAADQGDEGDRDGEGEKGDEGESAPGPDMEMEAPVEDKAEAEVAAEAGTKQ